MTDKEKLLSMLNNQESGCWTNAEFEIEEIEAITYIIITSHYITFAFDRFTGRFLYISNYQQ
jgi:inhibitor of KinA sporulation pathway (predicted exonuclease)